MSLLCLCPGINYLYIFCMDVTRTLTTHMLLSVTEGGKTTPSPGDCFHSDASRHSGLSFLDHKVGFAPRSAWGWSASKSSCSFKTCRPVPALSSQLGRLASFWVTMASLIYLSCLAFELADPSPQGPFRP